MASLTIRNLDDALKARLRIRAAQHGRSMEEEARQLIRDALKPEISPATTLSDIALSLFGPAHGIELQLEPRSPVRELPPAGGMILLDTNVISELMRPQPSAVVLRWIALQTHDELATTTITVAELNAGIAVLPEGARRRDLQSRAEQLLQRGLGPRIHAFDAAAAARYGEIFAATRRVGRPLIGLDLLIAAIARARGMVVATRNTADFEGCGVNLVNPWQTEPAQPA